jgi:hypothetical protein
MRGFSGQVTRGIAPRLQERAGLRQYARPLLAACVLATLACAPNRPKVDYLPGPKVDPAIGCVTGTVTWDGVPVAGAVITLHTVLDSVWTVTSDSAGAYCTNAPVGVTVLLATHATKNGATRIASGLTVPSTGANCGGACETVDLPLHDDGLNGAHFVVDAFVHALSPVPDQAYLFAFVRDDWTGLTLRDARIRVSAASGPPVTLAYNTINDRYEAGWPAGSLRATLPITLGETYRLDADLDDDGVDDGGGSLTVPAAVTIVEPAAHSVQPSDFDVVWQIAGDRTGMRYQAGIVEANIGFLQTVAEAGDSARAHFTGAPPGDYGATVRGYRGPGPVTMTGDPPNLSGPNLAGVFWGVIVARLDSFQVTRAAAGTPRRSASGSP